ncbi:unnamed protein product [Caenorhabditis angaria]|uniref:Uncharacterized protein n=1 Tax=Caenorhabditis angaria TaxID=860376 RepID=A0A9P1IN56_9PELO|nr:unnamed protein product [Caenorhabditis angaria]
MDEFLNDVIEIIREDQNVLPNNNNNQETLCTDEYDDYLSKTDPNLNEPDFTKGINESDDVLPVEPMKITPNNCNDRKYSISDDFGGMDLTYNNENVPEDELGVEISPEPRNINERKGRTSKFEMRKLSDAQKIEMIKSRQRSATNRSYEKKKTKLLQINENLMKLRGNVEEKKVKMRDVDMNLNNSLVMIRERIGKEMPEVWRDLKYYKMNYEKCLRDIEDDENIMDLERDLKNAERRFLEAMGDFELKIKNQNTYGSKKCRTKSKKDEAESLLNIKKLELEFEATSKYLENLDIVKNQVFNDFSEVRNLMNLTEMYNLNPEIREIFEDLLSFYNLPNPAPI